MPVTKQSVSLMPEIVAQIEQRQDAARGNFSGTINESLSRYFEMLRRERAALRIQFSGPELALLCDVLNGSLMQSYSIPLLYAEVEDSVPDGYAEKWQVDGPALAAKLRSLSYGQTAALVDAVERWWSGSYSGERPPFDEILR
jgi:hypothetical protein